MTARWGRSAWILMVAADVGLLVWGAMIALIPERFPGPRSLPILVAEYEGYTGGSWTELAATFPGSTAFIAILFRMYGIYIVAFGLMTVTVAVTAFRRGERWAWWALLAGNTIAYGSAMTFDWVVKAIGPWEVSEYVGLVAYVLALAFTVPSRGAGRRALAPG